MKAPGRRLEVRVPTQDVLDDPARAIVLQEIEEIAGRDQRRPLPRPRRPLLGNGRQDRLGLLAMVRRERAAARE